MTRTVTPEELKAMVAAVVVTSNKMAAASVKEEWVTVKSLANSIEADVQRLSYQAGMQLDGKYQTKE